MQQRVSSRSLARYGFGGNSVTRWTAKRRDVSLRITRSFRIWTGWLIALGYLACVLAPGAALALGTGPAPCLDVDFAIAAAPMHNHDGGVMHDHAMHVHDHADGGGPSTAHHHDHDGKGSPGPCCTIMCVSALPGALPEVVAPSQPVSTCTVAADLSLPGEAPPLLYRPPIRLS